MTSMDQIEQDLRYVRSAVEQAGASPTPRLLCFLWAALGGVGFALVDLRDAWVPAYWAVAGPAGFVVSAVLGWRHARRLGQGTARDGARHMLHWGGMLGAIALAVLLPARGLVPASAAGPVILLLLALGYFQAGVHLDPAFRWVGLLLATGYVLVLTMTTWGWLTLGVLFALALVATGLRAGADGTGD